MALLELHAESARAQAFQSGPGVPLNTFLGLVWAFAVLSTVFVAVRLYSRYRGPGRLYWDDAFAVLAWSLVLVTAPLWQRYARDVYYVLDLAAGLAPLEADYAARLSRGLGAALVVQVFFYSSLFSTKLSLLLFFRRLGSNVRGQRHLWWPVLAFAGVQYVVSVGDLQYHCLVNSSSAYIMTYCNESESIHWNHATLIANCVLDVVSELLIMAIPFTILWQVRIPLGKKLAFLGLFSLSVVTIAVAIARVADLDATTKASGQQDVSYLYLWSAIQSSLAVIVACLSAFPQLFQNRAARRSQNPPPRARITPTESLYQRMRARVGGGGGGGGSGNGNGSGNGSSSSLRKKKMTMMIGMEPLSDISTVSSPDGPPAYEAHGRPDLHGQPALRGAAAGVPGVPGPEAVLVPVQYNQDTQRFEYGAVQQQQQQQQQPVSEWHGGRAAYVPGRAFH